MSLAPGPRFDHDDVLARLGEGDPRPLARIVSASFGEVRRGRERASM